MLKKMSGSMVKCNEQDISERLKADACQPRTIKAVAYKEVTSFSYKKFPSTLGISVSLSLLHIINLNVSQILTLVSLG